MKKKKLNGFKLNVMTFKAYEQFKLRHISYFLFILKPILKMTKETNKGDIGNICPRVANHASKRVVKAEVNLN